MQSRLAPRSCATRQLGLACSTDPRRYRCRLGHLPLSGPGTSIEVRTVGLPSAAFRGLLAACCLRSRLKFKSRLASSRGARWQATPPVGPGARTWQVATSLRPSGDPKLCPQLERGFAELGDMHEDMAPAVLTHVPARKPTQASARPRRGPRPTAHLSGHCEPLDTGIQYCSSGRFQNSCFAGAASDLGVYSGRSDTAEKKTWPPPLCTLSA